MSWSVAAHLASRARPGLLTAIRATRARPFDFRVSAALASLASPIIKDRHSSVNQAWVRSLAVAATLGGILFGSSQLDPPAEALEQPKQHCSAEEVQDLMEWLKARGSRINGMTIESSGDASLRVYATGDVLPEGYQGWLGRSWSWVTRRQHARPVAAFPVSMAITASAVTSARGPAGPALAELQRLGLLDEGTLLVVHLALEKAKGSASSFAPYIRLLPQSFSSTLYFSDAELSLLKGTNLAGATVGKRRHLEDLWRRLEPALREVAVAEGLSAPLSFADFLWAYSAFWSRAMDLPMLTESEGEDRPPQLDIVMALVPGLDFCNHSAAPRAAWQVLEESKGKSGAKGAAVSKYTQPPTQELMSRDVKLVVEGRYPTQGEEVTISYGDKGNEELLFSYGFTLEDNPHDTLMLHCPIPPQEEWDEVMKSRLLLLLAQNLSPQFFLPRPKNGPATIPREVWATLDIFSMGKDRLRERVLEVEALGTSGAMVSAHNSSPQEVPTSPGQRMAILTTLVTLLEYKVLSLEGEDGTGPLEGDVVKLQEAQGMACTAASAGADATNTVNALRYRLGQKRLARQYLQVAREALQEVMYQMADKGS